MSKAEAGMKLVRWLPQIVEATADDIARYGPQAGRVRSLLDFLPTMSDDAATLSSAARDAGNNAAWNVARNAAWNAARNAAMDAERNAAMDAAMDAAWIAARARGAARRAARGEVVNDLVTPDVYRKLTNPLAAGREFDVLRPRAPENFLDVVRGLGERGLVTQPIDVLGARTLARDPQREALMEAINAIAGDTGYADTGYDSLSDLIEAARLLG